MALRHVYLPLFVLW